MAVLNKWWYNNINGVLAKIQIDPMQEDHLIMEYSQISPYIFLGTNWCCEKHFEGDLTQQGIEADISLEGEVLDQPWGVTYFLWLPTIDHTAPTMEALVLGVQSLTTLVNQKIKTYVHCKNGHGRAPTLVAAYFISKGLPVNRAIREVAKKRPEIHIEPVQVARLEEFARMVKW